MTRRTRHSVSRHFQTIEHTDSKGRVMETEIVKRREVLPAEPRKEWQCQCGMKYMVAIGQTIACKHQGVTRSEKRALIAKYGKKNWQEHISGVRSDLKRNIRPVLPVSKETGK